MFCEFLLNNESFDPEEYNLKYKTVFTPRNQLKFDV